MEKHKCRLCLRSFSNGRALGGHMRSHMMNLPIPPKDEKLRDEPAESASSQSLSQQQGQEFKEDEDQEEELLLDDDEKSAYYGLRENPKRSVKLVDPEFSMMILQDRESETESSKNPTRRRSKRPRKPDTHFDYNGSHNQYHSHFHDKPDSCWTAEPEPVSSISDATTEEDVAFCLMMMSRDNWPRKKYDDDFEGNDNDCQEDDYHDEDVDEDKEESEFEEDERQQQVLKCPRSSKYKCETCNKVFRSYQALGGHRASHKKIKLGPVVSSGRNDKAFEKYRESNRNNNHNSAIVVGVNEKKVHQCPVCFREFSSGQALGGHKRSHIMVSHETTKKPPAAKTTTAIVSPVVVVVNTRLNNKIGESLIDLNLPAPDYDEEDDEDEDCYDHDEISQIELSAVSDVEFVNNAIIRQ